MLQCKQNDSSGETTVKGGAVEPYYQYYERQTPDFHVHICSKRKQLRNNDGLNPMYHLILFYRAHEGQVVHLIFNQSFLLLKSRLSTV